MKHDFEIGFMINFYEIYTYLDLTIGPEYLFHL